MNAASGAGGTSAVYVYSSELIGTDGVLMETNVGTGVILGPFAYRISSNGSIQVRLGSASSDFSSLPLIYQLDAYEDYSSVNTVSITHDGPSEQVFEPEHHGTEDDHTNYEPDESYIVTGEDGIFEGQTSLDGSILYLDDLETAAPVLVDRIRQARENNSSIRVRAWGKDPIVEPSWYIWSTGQDTFVASGDGTSYAYSRTSGATVATDLSDEPMPLGEFSIIVAGATVATVLAILVVKGVLGGGDSAADNRVHLVLDKQ